ncbi:RecA RecA/RadA recombinase [uncultured Caudovirales phage]|uniref:RecA RecA/RadA recombinase n=1 Tax=uncultured Caudovirales phage TaxID=2100421 RepID=A0A6J5PZL6_9CAUD|nr:RecA RecA/RadA recombinase [uncultured Caudovirales phage]CAB4179794.1 RecA RecA/RadA recombinase [uncultured Caudovirales phage]CAB4188343.1 RecA RecA/RadA recombinase [uncultured Caudovirales phage]
MAISGDLAKVFASINKTMGAGTVVVGSDIRDDVMGYVTTGSVSLDVALGGGWPINQWHEVIGEESQGKTAIALKTIAANQKRDPEFTTVWVAAEQWVPGYAEMCGVDVSRVYVVSTNIMEEAYEAVIRVVESKTIDCIVIDSLPALVPGAENEKDMDEFTVGRGALLTNKFFRKVGKASKRSLIDYERPFIGLMINQWRDKVGVMYGDPRTTPGGKGKNYSYFTRVDVRRDEWIEAGAGEEKRRIGQTIKARVLKNKSAPPSRVATFDFYFASGGEVEAGNLDFAKELISIGKLNKVIARAGAYLRYAERQWQGQDAMLASIREEIDLATALERDVLDSIKAGSKFAYED